MEFQDAVLRVSPLLQMHLEDLKIKFSHVIGSNRTMGHIASFGDLVKVLIKRDFLDPSIRNWSCLDNVCMEFLGQNFEEAGQFRHPVISASKPVKSASSINEFARRDLPQLHPRVVEYVADHIGEYQWRSLARALRVKECDITALDNSHVNDPVACVHEILKLYVSRIPYPTSGEIVKVLRKALITIRRDDLVENVNLILSSVTT